MCGGAAPDHHGHLVWIQVQLLLRVVQQDALSEVMKVYPLRKLRVSVGDIEAFTEERTKEEKVLKSMRREVEERESKVIAPCSCFEEIWGMQGKKELALQPALKPQEWI